MELAHEIAVIFRKIQHLKAEPGNDEDHHQRQSEIFQLFGVIERILKLEGCEILEELEPPLMGTQVLEALEEAREQLNQAKIVPSVSLPPTENLIVDVDNAPFFPEYFLLPGYLVREKILNFLSPQDLVNLASVASWEAEEEWFPQPLTHLQLHLVFPLLYKMGLLNLMDVLNLSEAFPYFRTFITKHYEQILWKDNQYLCNTIYTGIPLKDFAKVNLKNRGPVVCHVQVQPIRRNDELTLSQLKTCGKYILHCALKLPNGLTSQQSLEEAATLLEHMPNLKVLSVEDPKNTLSLQVAHEDQEDNPDFKIPELPNLPCLKTLLIIELTESFSCLKRVLLAKYGAILDSLQLYSIGEAEEDATPLAGASLSTLVHSMIPFALPNRFFNSLHVFRKCPLKTLFVSAAHLNGPMSYEYCLWNLLAEFYYNWGETLEELQINLTGFRSLSSRNLIPFEESSAMTRLRFPKLKRLTLTGCPKSWAFLLLFPNLEELVYHHTFEPNASRDEPGAAEPLITMYSDKRRTLTSNIWKVLGKLKQVSFDVVDVVEGVVNGERAYFSKLCNITVTREECIAFQGEGIN